MLRYALAVIVILSASASAQAASGLPMIITGANGLSLDSTKMYVVDIDCAPTANALPNPTLSSWDKLWISDVRTFTHFVYVTPNVTNTAVTLNTTPGAMSMLSLAYSDDQGAGGQIDNLGTLASPGGACHQEELLTNPPRMYFAGVAAYTSNVTAGTIGTYFSNLLSAVTTLAPVLTGTALTPNTSKTLSAIGSAISPLDALAQLFQSSGTSTEQRGDELKVGTTTIVTKYSTVTITVTQIDSIVNYGASHPSTTFASDLEAAVKTSGLTVNSSNLSGSCQLIANALAEAGFQSDVDQIFATIYAATKTVTNKTDLYSCLGDDFAATSIDPHNQAVWQGVQHSLVLTANDLALLHVEAFKVPKLQPPWASMQALPSRFKHAVSSYAQSTAPSAAQAANLQKYVGPNVTIIDPNTELGNAPIPKGCPKLFDFLIAAGYRYFQFDGPVTDGGMLSSYGTHGGIVALQASSSGVSVPVNHTIALLPVVKGGVIAYFEVTKDFDEINLVATAGKANSGGFTITPVPPAGAGGPAPQ